MPHAVVRLMRGSFVFRHTENTRTENTRTENTRTENTRAENTCAENTRAENTRTENTRAENTHKFPVFLFSHIHRSKPPCSAPSGTGKASHYGAYNGGAFCI